MPYVLVDFDTHMGRDFDRQRPIGVWITLSPFGVAFHYLPEVEDGSDPGHDNYMTTFRQLEDPLVRWRAGEEIRFGAWLEYVSETSYLGQRFRAFAWVEGDLTIEDAFRRFVLEAEPLPVAEAVDVV